jgi:pyridoxal phosphate enzyme (YggS family)
VPAGPIQPASPGAGPSTPAPDPHDDRDATAPGRDAIAALPGSLDETEVAGLAAARAAIQERIAAACARAGRDPARVRLVAVSKTVPAARLRAAVAAGLDVLAENRVQEAASKIPLVPGACWHLVGPLQANKARRAVELFRMIETVDSVELAARLDRIVREVRGLPPAGPVEADRRLPVLVQVNVDRDGAKAGFTPEAAADALSELAALGALELAGLMTIGRLGMTPEGARPTFRSLRQVAAILRAGVPALGPELSMGMSDDFEVAIEEGATIVRVGRALFGEGAGGPTAPFARADEAVAPASRPAASPAGPAGGGSGGPA